MIREIMKLNHTILEKKVCFFLPKLFLIFVNQTLVSTLTVYVKNIIYEIHQNQNDLPFSKTSVFRQPIKEHHRESKITKLVIKIGCVVSVVLTFYLKANELYRVYTNTYVDLYPVELALRIVALFTSTMTRTTC